MTVESVEDQGERNWSAIIGGVVLFLLLIVLIIASNNTGQLGRLVWTAVTIVIVLVTSVAVFSGSNLLVSQAALKWGRYRTLVGALLGAFGGALLRGNRSVGALVQTDTYILLPDEPGGDPFVLEGDNIGIADNLRNLAVPELFQIGEGFLGHIEWPLAGLVLGGLAGAATGLLPQRAMRIAGAVVPALIAGWLIASNLQFALRPDASLLWMAIWIAIGAVAGGALGAATRFPVERALAGAAVGSLVGGWLIPDVLGTGSLGATRLAVIVPLVLFALRFAWPGFRSPGELADFNRRARAVIFLGPALLFLAANLVIPAVRTIYTSLLDRESEDWVGLANFEALVRDSEFIDFSDWTNIFTSQIFIVGLVLLIAGAAIGTVIHQRRHASSGFEVSGGSLGPIVLGVFLLLTAGFVVVRGTFSNTIWWALTVTFVSTVLGLVIAVLSERAGRLESVAKSLIFMPMALSLVGASIIWRFQYTPRNISKNQTGVLNALWIRLGDLSHSGWPRIVVLLILAALLAITGLRAASRIREGRGFAGFVAVGVVLLYLIVELLRRSLGGFAFGPEGELIADTVAFREHAPFNNIFLMVILIWMQAGFAMVILSAAIKAVPAELIEAAKIDGADDSQQFFNVILPQILPTVGVVVTAIVVGVAKVFDIVKVSTGGNFGTNVLANDFFTESFQNLDRGIGSAIAVLILATVAPILVLNVRQMQKEAA